MKPELIEQETIINFNKEEKIASIFTYEKTWQQHLEKRLGLKPIMDNGFGGREYEIYKKRIPMPRAPKKLSDDTRRKLSERMSKISNFRRKTTVTTVNQTPLPSSRGDSILSRGRGKK